MSVLEALRLKHPEPADPGVSQSAFLPYPAPPPMVDLDITGGHIKTVARWLRGGAGPGGSDSSAWQDWLLRFGGQSERLRDAVAQLARVIANGLVPWEVIRALLSSRLIALDKCPGVRPIGIGECLRRVMAKAVMIVAGGDVQEVCGSDQLCSGLQAGIEAAIHAMHDLFEEHKGSGWGVLLVDASNAFNSLNRKAALWNARHLWPQRLSVPVQHIQGACSAAGQWVFDLAFQPRGCDPGRPSVHGILRAERFTSDQVTEG